MDASNDSRYEQLSIRDNQCLTLVLASAGATDIVTELVGAGASVIAENDKGITVLHYAAR